MTFDRIRAFQSRVYSNIKSTVLSILFLQFSTCTTTAWYMLINKPRIDAYRDFYKTYDADAEFERMKVMDDDDI